MSIIFTPGITVQASKDNQPIGSLLRVTQVDEQIGATVIRLSSRWGASSAGRREPFTIPPQHFDSYVEVCAKVIRSGDRQGEFCNRLVAEGQHVCAKHAGVSKAMESKRAARDEAHARRVAHGRALQKRLESINTTVGEKMYLSYDREGNRTDQVKVPIGTLERLVTELTELRAQR